MTSPTTLHPAREAILTQVLHGLERNRVPGYHFPGNFLGLSFDELQPERTRVSMQAGPHCLDRNGEADMSAFCVLADIALASAVRAALQRSMRLATVSLQMQFTGLPRQGHLVASSTFNGYFHNGRAQQGLSRFSLSNAAGEVCFGHGAFMVLEPPAGFKLPRMLPHQGPLPGAPLLAPDSLNADEAGILDRTHAALSTAQTGSGSFIENFWGFTTRKNRDGASATLKNGSHVANRVGHVQGGILIGLAEAAARAALPAHWAASGLTACYLSPGEGATLTARAKTIHQGSRTAVLHSIVTGANRRRVLETVATYAAVERA